VPRAVSGALLGAFQTLGSGRLATVRDSSDGGAMLAGLLMRGPSKVAAGIAAAIAARWIDGVHPAKEAALAAGLGVAMGVGLSAIGFSPLSTLASAVACGAAAGGGVVIGPRFSQLVRNLGKDAGTGIERGLRGTGVIAGPLPATTRNCLGALPAGLASEAVKGLLYADGSPVGIVLGGIGAAVQLVEIYANASPKPLSKRAAAALQRAARSRPAAAPQAAAGAGVPSAAAQSSGDDASLKGAAAGTSAPIPRTAAA